MKIYSPSNSREARSVTQEKFARRMSRRSRVKADLHGAKMKRRSRIIEDLGGELMKRKRASRSRGTRPVDEEVVAQAYGLSFPSLRSQTRSVDQEELARQIKICSWSKSRSAHAQTQDLSGKQMKKYSPYK